MPRLFPLAIALLALLATQSPALARGRGVRSFLLTADGQLATELGETRSELLDPVAFVRYRFHEGQITAAPLDKPTEVLWKAAVTPRLWGRQSGWRLLPELLVIFGEDKLTGIDPASGKILYSTPIGAFAENLALLQYTDEKTARPSVYLLDDRAQREQPRGENKVAATLARFDLRRGEFLWKTPIVTAAGEKLRPVEIDPRGLVRGEQEAAEFYFDPATGKALEKPAPPPPLPRPEPAPRLAATPEKIEFLDAAGKTIWSRAEPGKNGPALLTTDSVVIPRITGDRTTQVIALDLKDGRERWRCTLPGGFFADQVEAEVRAAKRGYLVQLSWIVLD